MCPLCWATMFATVSVSVGGAAAVVVWRDWLSLALAVVVVVTASIQLFGWMTIPWWGFVLMVTALIARFIWLVARHRERILFVNAWRRAKAIRAAWSASPSLGGALPTTQICPNCEES